MTGISQPTTDNQPETIHTIHTKVQRNTQSSGLIKALYTVLLGWQTCSIKHHLSFFGKYLATLQLMQEDCLYTISITVYTQVLIHTAELIGAT